MQVIRAHFFLSYPCTFYFPFCHSTQARMSAILNRSSDIVSSHPYVVPNIKDFNIFIIKFGVCCWVLGFEIDN